MRNKSLLILLLSFCLNIQAEEVALDVQQISRFFSNKGIVDKVPFSLSQLELFYTQLNKPKARKFKKITKKYLDLSFPQGTVSLNSITDSVLPNSSKVIILKSNGRSLLLKTQFNVLLDTSPELLAIIPRESVKIEGLSISAKNIEEQASEYNHNINFSAYVRIHDSSGKEYLVSSPSDKHAISEAFSKISGSFTVKFSNLECTDIQCVTHTDSNAFSSFKFRPTQMVQLSLGDNVVAKCHYENIYRREYQNHSVTEIAYKNCELRSINGNQPTKIDPILERLYK